MPPGVPVPSVSEYYFFEKRTYAAFIVSPVKIFSKYPFSERGAAGRSSVARLQDCGDGATVLNSDGSQRAQVKNYRKGTGSSPKSKS